MSYWNTIVNVINYTTLNKGIKVKLLSAVTGYSNITWSENTVVFSAIIPSSQTTKYHFSSDVRVKSHLLDLSANLIVLWLI